MITLNDYLYSGDTIFRILQKYTTDLRKDAKKHRNEIDALQFSGADQGTIGAQ